MVVLFLVAALAIGGGVGALVRRRAGRRGGANRRTLDDASVGTQAGFTNQGPQSLG